MQRNVSFGCEALVWILGEMGTGLQMEACLVCEIAGFVGCQLLSISAEIVRFIRSKYRAMLGLLILVSHVFS